MIKPFLLILPLVASSIQIEGIQAAAEASNGCGGGQGPQGPAGPRGPQGATGAQGTNGSNGYTAAALADGSSVSLVPGSNANPALLASVTITAPEQGKVLLTTTGNCAFFGSHADNYAMIAIRNGGDNTAINASQGVTLGIPRVPGNFNVSWTGGFSTQKLVDVNAGGPSTFSVYAGRLAVDPSIGTDATCKAQLTALFVKSAF